MALNTERTGPMLTKGTVLAAALGLALGSTGLTATQAYAWHQGVEHDEVDHGGERPHGPRIEIGPGGVGVDDGDHHRPRHHEHCRLVEYEDHHDAHRTREICD